MLTLCTMCIHFKNQLKSRRATHTQISIECQCSCSSRFAQLMAVTVLFQLWTNTKPIYLVIHSTQNQFQYGDFGLEYPSAAVWFWSAHVNSLTSCNFVHSAIPFIQYNGKRKKTHISLSDRNKNSLLVETNYQCMRSTTNHNRFGHLAITISRCMYASCRRCDFAL